MRESIIMGKLRNLNILMNISATRCADSCSIDMELSPAPIDIAHTARYSASFHTSFVRKELL